MTPKKFSLSVSRTVSIAVMVMVLSACSTVAMHTDETLMISPYGGTKRAVEFTQRSWNNPSFIGEPVLYAFDIALCLIADTLLLPYDYYRYSQE